MKIVMGVKVDVDYMVENGLFEDESVYEGEGVYMSDDDNVEWVKVSDSNEVEVMDEIDEGGFVDECYEERYDDVVRYYWWVG